MNDLTNKISFPDIIENTYTNVSSLIETLGVPNNIIASKENIIYAYKELPREIQRLDPKLRNEFVARMVIATSVGLFDGALNYIWNAVIINLRNKVKTLGFETVKTILNDNGFDNDKLDKYRDSELLNICRKLDLISENDYFMLDQNREIRNNYSSAHPMIAQIDDRELINFVSRCCKHGLTNISPKGFKINEVLTAIKGSRIKQNQVDAIIDKLKNTVSFQQSAVVQMLYGLYCSKNESESTRLNAYDICNNFKDYFDDQIVTELIKQHEDYRTQNMQDSFKASQKFFKDMNMFHMLSESEIHATFYKLISSLLTIHREFNNFYNEPPLAERLWEYSQSTPIPKTIKLNYVYSVIECYLGNGYGVSVAAIPFYEKMIKNFSPIEIDYLLKIPDSDKDTKLQNIIRKYPDRKHRYIKAINLLDETSFSTTQKQIYKKIINK